MEPNLICQPSYSLGFNVLDLGYLISIQFIQYQCFPKNIDAVVKNIFLTVQKSLKMCCIWQLL